MPGIVDALDALPPWDAAVYFQAIRQVNVSGPQFGGAVELVGADPMRVALIISVPGLSQTWIGTDSTAGQSGGFVLTNALPPIMLTFAQFGPLVQMQWFITSGTGIVTAWSVSLSKWPVLNGKKKGAKNAADQKPVNGDRRQRGRTPGPR